MMDERMRREMQEAIDAGDRALLALQQANKYLESAGRWGLADIFGGGLIVDLVKHSKIREASSYMERAKQELNSFVRELRDVEWIVQDLDMGSFLPVADFLFDGLIADVMMQSKIAKAKEQVREAIVRVDAILTRLQEKMREA